MEYIPGSGNQQVLAVTCIDAEPWDSYVIIVPKGHDSGIDDNDYYTRCLDHYDDATDGDGNKFGKLEHIVKEMLEPRPRNPSSDDE